MDGDLEGYLQLCLSRKHLPHDGRSSSHCLCIRTTRCHFYVMVADLPSHEHPYNVRIRYETFGVFFSVFVPPYQHIRNR